MHTKATQSKDAALTNTPRFADTFSMKSRNAPKTLILNGLALDDSTVR